MSERSHPHGRERAGRARPAQHLLGFLTALGQPRSCSPKTCGALALIAALGLGALACDQGSQHEQKQFTRYVSLVSSTVDALHPLPVDGVIVLQFDRYLNPSTITRQSFVVADAGNNPLQGAVVSYDPIALTVTISGPNSATTGTSQAAPWVTEGQSYKIFLPVSGSETDPSGLRAIDNAPLDPSVGPIEIAFNVGPKGTPSSTPTMKFCTDVLPVLEQKCGSGTKGVSCHGAPDSTSDAIEGLILNSPDGVAQTAIGRISQESNTSGISGQAVPPNRVFGLNYPIIDPGHAATSWLMYKVAMAPPPDGAFSPVAPPSGCAGPQPFSIKTSAFPVSDDEAAALSDAVLGRPMPYPTYDTQTYGYSPLTFDERERFRLWIDQGARIESCGMCQ